MTNQSPSVLKYSPSPWFCRSKLPPSEANGRPCCVPFRGMYAFRGLQRAMFFLLKRVKAWEGKRFRHGVQNNSVTSKAKWSVCVCVCLNSMFECWFDLLSPYIQYVNLIMPWPRLSVPCECPNHVVTHCYQTWFLGSTQFHCVLITACQWLTIAAGKCSMYLQGVTVAQGVNKGPLGGGMQIWYLAPQLDLRNIIAHVPKEHKMTFANDSFAKKVQNP